MKNIIAVAFLCLFNLNGFAAEPGNLQQLLEKVKKERTQEKEELAKRELKFKNALDQQRQLLAEATIHSKKQSSAVQHSEKIMNATKSK